MIAFLLAVAAVLLIANRPLYVDVDAPLPVGFEATGFQHDSFEDLLRQWVSADGNIDYAGWHASDSSRTKLDRYLAAVSQFSPTSASERFETRSDELAYWMYAYNAYVIKSVLDHWPIASVTDVKAPIEAISGLGFFYRQRFKFGGEYMSLLSVENSIIRKQYQDARIHFVLSCASGSCPIVRPELPTGAALEQFLATAATEFASDPGNISVDHKTRRVILSRIFKWYRSDFETAVRLTGQAGGDSLIAYARSIAPEPLAGDLKKAGDYEVVFNDYDWALNISE
ncbi:MAG: DUF547 domain-containing protein [Woeseiaceae bacterium]